MINPHGNGSEVTGARPSKYANNVIVLIVIFFDFFQILTIDRRPLGIEVSGAHAVSIRDSAWVSPLMISYLFSPIPTQDSSPFIPLPGLTQNPSVKKKKPYRGGGI